MGRKLFRKPLFLILMLVALLFLVSFVAGQKAKGKKAPVKAPAKPPAKPPVKPAKAPPNKAPAKVPKAKKDVPKAVPKKEAPKTAVPPPKGKDDAKDYGKEQYPPATPDQQPKANEPEQGGEEPACKGITEEEFSSFNKQPNSSKVATCLCKFADSIQLIFDDACSAVCPDDGVKNNIVAQAKKYKENFKCDINGNTILASTNDNKITKTANQAGSAISKNRNNLYLVSSLVIGMVSFLFFG